MSALSLGNQALLLILGSLIVIAASSIISALLAGFGVFKQKVFQILAASFAAFIMLSLVMLLVDNFTYTVFKIGIQTIKAPWTYLYLTFLIFLFVKFTGGYVRKSAVDSCQRGLFAYGGLLTSVACVLVISFYYLKSEQVYSSDSNLPNIIFFASDGIEAKHLSAYGYERATSPNLDKLMPQMLVAENAFTNCGRSTGSVTAMLTGKLPITSKVLFPPHMLAGQHSAEHLPGILKRLGYRSLQETARYYLDSHDIGMVNSFDEVNQRKFTGGIWGLLPEKFGSRFFFEIYFVETIYKRISERWLKLLGIKEMINPLDLVDEEKDFKVYGEADQNRIERIKNFISASEQPFFIHTHLMDSHCCLFKPANPVFSKGRKGRSNNHYDDIILESDRLFGEMISWLKQTGKFDNTVIVYTSDHARRWSTGDRVPFMIRFPEGKHSGRVENNVQLADLAPTIMDYLGEKIPEWMEGQSLLKPLPEDRVVLSISSINRKKSDNGKEKLSSLVGAGPPFYGAKSLAVTYCDNQYNYSLEEEKFISELKIEGHTKPCAGEVDENFLLKYVKERLKERNFGR